MSKQNQWVKVKIKTKKQKAKWDWSGQTFLTRTIWGTPTKKKDPESQRIVLTHKSWGQRGSGKLVQVQSPEKKHMKVAWHRLKHWWRFQDEPFILYPVCWKTRGARSAGSFCSGPGTITSQCNVRGNQSAAWMGATGVNQSEKDKHGTGSLADWHLFLRQYSNWSLPVIASFIFTGCIFLSFFLWMISRIISMMELVLLCVIFAVLCICVALNNSPGAFFYWLILFILIKKCRKWFCSRNFLTKNSDGDV